MSYFITDSVCMLIFSVPLSIAKHAGDSYPIFVIFTVCVAECFANNFPCVIAFCSVVSDESLTFVCQRFICLLGD